MVFCFVRVSKNRVSGGLPYKKYSYIEQTVKKVGPWLAKIRRGGPVWDSPAICKYCRVFPADTAEKPYENPVRTL